MQWQRRPPLLWIHVLIVDSCQDWMKMGRAGSTSSPFLGWRVWVDDGTWSWKNYLSTKCLSLNTWKVQTSVKDPKHNCNSSSPISQFQPRCYYIPQNYIDLHFLSKFVYSDQDHHRGLLLLIFRICSGPDKLAETINDLLGGGNNVKREQHF